MVAAVAMYTFFSSPKPIKKAPLIAPPVPINPAKNPEIPPPVMLVIVWDGNLIFFLKKDIMANIIKKMPRNNFNNSCDVKLTIYAPIMVKRTLGIPNKIINFLSSPPRKKLTRPRLPEMCAMATKTKANLKSTKISAKGNRIVEDPKPAMVPPISEK